MNDEQTIAAYDRQAAQYAELAKTDQAQQGLDGFLQLLAADAEILDLGCGPGHTAAEMVRRGFRVDAIDASPAMARLAKELHDLAVRVADFSALEAIGRYDGAWVSFSLLHAPRAAFPGHLTNIYRALRPNGALFLGMKLGHGEARDSLGRHYSYYSEDELEQGLSAAGFDILSKTLGEGLGLAGHVEPWITIIARRRA